MTEPIPIPVPDLHLTVETESISASEPPRGLTHVKLTVADKETAWKEIRAEKDGDGSTMLYLKW